MTTFPPEMVEVLAKRLKPEAFEVSNGLGHQQFAEEDREDRERARQEATDYLTALQPWLLSDQDRERLRAIAAEVEAHDVLDIQAAYLRELVERGRT